MSDITLLSDAQAVGIGTAIVTGAGILAGALKWIWNLHVKSRTDSEDRYAGIFTRSEDTAREMIQVWTRVEGKLNWLLRDTSGVHEPIDPTTGDAIPEPMSITRSRPIMTRPKTPAPGAGERTLVTWPRGATNQGENR